MNKKIKLTLLGTLVASSALAITLPIVSCSASSNELITIIGIDPNTTQDASNVVTEKLENELSFAKTKEAQKNIVSEWKVGDALPNNYINEIKNELDFKISDSKTISGNDAIQSIVFNSITTIPDTGPIKGPSLKVIFKEKYKPINDITFDANTLGDVLGDVVLGHTGTNTLNSRFTTYLINQFNTATTRDAQLALLESWRGKKANQAMITALKGYFNFTIDGNKIDFDVIVKDITFTNVPELPEAGKGYFNVRAKINLNPGYDSPTEFMLFSITKIGDAK
ncbi:MAG: hypothetical protein ACRDCD_01715 [Mycoplasmoidaceae bacterium]